jgi:hypothetical protein
MSGSHRSSGTRKRVRSRSSSRSRSASRDRRDKKSKVFILASFLHATQMACLTYLCLLICSLISYILPITLGEAASPISLSLEGSIVQEAQS